MDSELEERSHNKVSEDVMIGIEPNPTGRVLDQSSDIDSETDTASQDTRNEQEGPVQFVSDTFLKVDGKTLLQPVRETPNMHPQLEPVGNACSCSCCSERKEQKWEEMGRQLEELKWRAENAEVDKQKYQNQIYAIRTKYEARLTPFREVFEEVSHGSLSIVTVYSAKTSNADVVFLADVKTQTGERVVAEGKSGKQGSIGVKYFCLANTNDRSVDNRNEAKYGTQRQAERS
jgi:hypothetical protein